MAEQWIIKVTVFIIFTAKEKKICFYFDIICVKEVESVEVGTNSYLVYLCDTIKYI